MRELHFQKESRCSLTIPIWSDINDPVPQAANQIQMDISDAFLTGLYLRIPNDIRNSLIIRFADVFLS